MISSLEYCDVFLMVVWAKQKGTLIIYLCRSQKSDQIVLTKIYYNGIDPDPDGYQEFVEISTGKSHERLKNNL